MRLWNEVKAENKVRSLKIAVETEERFDKCISARDRLSGSVLELLRGDVKRILKPWGVLFFSEHLMVSKSDLYASSTKRKSVLNSESQTIVFCNQWRGEEGVQLWGRFSCAFAKIFTRALADWRWWVMAGRKFSFRHALSSLWSEKNE